MHGAPCWVSLATRGLAEAERFYGEVLGWSFRPGRMGEEFSVAYRGEVPVAGLGAIARTMGVAVQWTPFFVVPDADAAAARVRERSATVAVGPLRMGDGRTALAADLAGATFGIWEGPVLASWHPDDGDLPARLELRTRDAFAAAIFYAEVFDWACERGRCEVDYRHEAVVVHVGGRNVATVRGGAIEAAPDPRIRPRWEISFSVDDVDDAAKTAVAAGGTVAASPFDGHFGRAACLLDPEGGLFLVHTPR